MLRETTQSFKGKARRRVKFHGIGKDADALKVSRIHLWLVLTHRRQSRSLLARYNQLKGVR